MPYSVRKLNWIKAWAHKGERKQEEIAKASSTWNHWMHNWRAFSLWSIYFYSSRVAVVLGTRWQNKKKAKMMPSTTTKAIRSTKNLRIETHRPKEKIHRQFAQKDAFSILKILSFDCLSKKEKTFLNCFGSWVAVAEKDTHCLQSFDNGNCYYNTHAHRSRTQSGRNTLHEKITLANNFRVQ